ncbi:MAG TPA: hypothetical protein VN753_11170 [Terracidiphilus sp.]|nr:hypothetical protein [Terracidiphilus sp.]
MALIAAGVAFLNFPIGFVRALYTFSVLLGRHHAATVRPAGVDT